MWGGHPPPYFLISLFILTFISVRRKRRKLQKLWDTKETERRKAIIKLREDNFKEEKKRVQTSDWWDWYVPYDNKPMQF